MGSILHLIIDVHVWKMFNEKIYDWKLHIVCNDFKINVSDVYIFRLRWIMKF